MYRCIVLVHMWIMLTGRHHDHTSVHKEYPLHSLWMPRSRSRSSYRTIYVPLPCEWDAGSSWAFSWSSLWSTIDIEK